MHKMKKLASCLCFVIILGILLSMAASLLERKASTTRYSEFWENPKEYDVWFMGTSHVYYAIQPMELWNQYGIRSYVLAAPSSTIPQTYWTIMCALQYSQPKVIVLDTYKVHLDKKQQVNEELIHTNIDVIPLSGTKIKAICDIFDTQEDRLEYLCKFSIYHNRWEELTIDDFRVKESVTKGGIFKNDVIDNSDFQNIPKEDISHTDTVGFLYLEKIIQECQERGIELVLTELPFCSEEDMQRAMNAVPEMAEEYGLPCLNFAYEEGIVDYAVDFGDEAHVNLFGSKKIMRYLGDFLKDNCNLTDYRESDEISEKWNADYEEYLQLKLSKMRDAGTMESYVQWLLDDRYTCYMYQKKEPGGLLEREIAQLENITYISLEEAQERMGGKIKGEYALFVEDSSGEVVDQAVFKKGKRV